MLQVTPAGTRAGSSAVGEPASAALLALESLGDSEPGSAGSASSLDVESLSDSSSREGSSERSREPFLVLESLGDSGARGDSEARGDSDGLACGDADEVGPPELPLPDPPPEPPLDPGEGLAVGEDVEDVEDVGDEVGDGLGVGVGVDERVTGGAMPGGALGPAARSCCHDQPSDPPSGTVAEPTPEDEYVHAAFEPSAHHSPQYASAGEAFTHGSPAGTPLTRHTNPGCLVA